MISSLNGTHISLWLILDSPAGLIIMSLCQPPMNKRFMGLSWTIKFLTLRLLTEPCRPRLAFCHQSAKRSRSGGLHVVQCWPLHSNLRQIQYHHCSSTCNRDVHRHVYPSCNPFDLSMLEKPIPPAFLQVLPYGSTPPEIPQGVLATRHCYVFCA